MRNNLLAVELQNSFEYFERKDNFQQLKIEKYEQEIIKLLDGIYILNNYEGTVTKKCQGTQTTATGKVADMPQEELKGVQPNTGNWRKSRSRNLTYSNGRRHNREPPRRPRPL